MKVCKFGGSSLADGNQIARIIRIINSDPARRIVVVSAPGKRDADDTKVTDLLIACAERVLDNEEYAEILAKIVERYAAIQQDLELPYSVIDSIKMDLCQRIASRDNNAAAFLDSMKAAGEDNTAKLVAAALQQQGVKAGYLSPQEAGLVLEGDFGNGRLVESSNQRIAQALQQVEGVVVFPGFFGYNSDNKVVTFPRGGSDITGSILAAAIKADVYENFTDVDSVYPVDPRLVPEVSSGITEMTYREMRELSYSGFGVFHDEAVIPAFKAGIPINVRNTNHPDEPGTMIFSSRTVKPGTVVGIASDDGFCCIFVDKYMMNREVGFGRRLLQILEDEKVSYEHMPSGIDNVSVVIREVDFNQEREERVKNRILVELEPDAVLIERGYALIMVVGEGLYYTVGMAARTTRALAEAGVNIEIMNQGSSEISMMFGVRSEQRTIAVQALYKEFWSGKKASHKVGKGHEGKVISKR